LTGILSAGYRLTCSTLRYAKRPRFFNKPEILRGDLGKELTRAELDDMNLKFWRKIYSFLGDEEYPEVRSYFAESRKLFYYSIAP
jgi:hypothetical protein